MAKVSVWKNRKPFAFLIKYYNRNLKPASEDVLRLRRRADALSSSEHPEEQAKAKELYAEEKKLIGKTYYDLCCACMDWDKIEIEVEGRENLPDENTACCFVANHQGYADVLALGYALDGLQISFIAKNALEKVPFYGKFIQDIRGIYIPTKESKREHVAIINRGVEYLEKGFNMAIFPEGTRSWGPAFYSGGFMKGSLQLACRAGAPVVPVAIEGSYHIFEDQGYIAPGKIIVHILPAVPTKGVPKPEWGALTDRVYESVKAEVIRIQRAIGITANEQ